MSPLSSPKLKARNRAVRTATLSSLPRRVLTLCLVMCLLWMLFTSQSWVWSSHDLAGISKSMKFGMYTIPDNSSLGPPRTLLVPVNPSHSALSTATTKNLDAMLDPYSLTTVLPITPSSLSTLELTLLTLLEHSRYVSEIILVAPQSIQFDVRSILRNIVSSGGSYTHVELSLTPWLPGASEDATIVDLARQVTTDFVLCLDSTGLDAVPPPARDVLMLIKPISVDLPVGPHGVDSAHTCIASSAMPQVAAFLIPPFVVPSALLSEVTPAEEHFDTWFALGKRIAQSRADMVGGIVIGIEEPVLDWCPLGRPAAPSQPFQAAQGPQLALNEEDNADGDVPSLLQPSPSSNGTFLLIFSSVQELHQFSPAACRLQRSGHTLHALLYDDALDAGALSDHDDIHLTQGDCRLKHSLFRWPSVGTKDETPILARFKDLALLTDVIIASSGHDSLSVALSHLLVHYEEVAPLLIHIPRKDLPYCDWMGSLTLQEWQNWHIPRVDIAVITNDRPRSLTRLLSSLSSACYFGDSLDLRINVEQTADSETLRVVDDFQWSHGRVFSHHRVVHGGLLTAVVESWYPRSNDSYGLLLEDDVELSPLFYAWVKMSILRYRYGAPVNRSSQLFGISLYQQKHLELRPEGRHRFSARSTFAAAGISSPGTPYLSQIPCSWGAVYFPEHWREFHAYLAFRLSAAVWSTDAVVVPGVRSNRWARSWKKYFIELVFIRGYVMLYPNFADYASLSTNHLEVGAHVKEAPTETYMRKKKLFLLPLMRLPDLGAIETPGTGLLDLPDEALPPWTTLPVLDLLGLLSTEELLAERGRLRRAELTRCSDAAYRRHDVWDLLCLDDSPFALPTLERDVQSE